MCAGCAGYDHSQNCGTECSDHAYEIDQEWTARFADPGEELHRCTRCGCCKLLEAR